MEGLAKNHPYAARYPELGTGPVPLSVNTSAEYFSLEKEKIFRRAWQTVGRVEEIPNPGDYFVHEIPLLETSLLIVRGRDNTIRAFHNMCRHRGNKVVHSGHLRGNAKGFSCAFHGWTYDLSGKLVIVPDEDQFFDFDKKDHGLTPIACDVWEGFIWVALEPRESLREWLGELTDQFQGYFQDLHLFGHCSADVNVHWKVFYDAFAEGYHVPFIHMKTLPEVLSGADNPMVHLQNVELYDLHRKLSFPANQAYQPTPIEAAIMKFIDMPVFPALKSDLDKLPPGVNPDKNPAWGFDINYIFPVSGFGVWANGSLQLSWSWPIDAEWTRWEMKLYWAPPKNAAERINQEITRNMIVNVTREDLSSLETTQEMLFSGATDKIYLSDQEVALRHNYQVVERFLRD